VTHLAWQNEERVSATSSRWAALMALPARRSRSMAQYQPQHHFRLTMSYTRQARLGNAL